MKSWIIIFVIGASTLKTFAEDSFTLGGYQLAPLSQQHPLKGINAELSYHFYQGYLLLLNTRYLTNNQRHSDFTLQQYKLGLGYFWQTKVNWQYFALAGALREKFTQKFKSYTHTADSNGWFATLGIRIPITTRLKSQLSIDSRSLYGSSRYYLVPQLSYQLSNDWQLIASLALGFDQQFKHDANEYMFAAKYLF